MFGIFIRLVCEGCITLLFGWDDDYEANWPPRVSIHLAAAAVGLICASCSFPASVHFLDLSSPASRELTDASGHT